MENEKNDQPPQVEITNHGPKVQTENKPINELCCKNPLYETTLLESNDQKVTEFGLELPNSMSNANSRDLTNTINEEIVLSNRVSNSKNDYAEIEDLNPKKENYMESLGAKQGIHSNLRSPSNYQDINDFQQLSFNNSRDLNEEIVLSNSVSNNKNDYAPKEGWNPKKEIDMESLDANQGIHSDLRSPSNYQIINGFPQQLNNNYQPLLELPVNNSYQEISFL